MGMNSRWEGMGVFRIALWCTRWPNGFECVEGEELQTSPKGEGMGIPGQQLDFGSRASPQTAG